MKVLIVEDNPTDVELIRAILKECRWDMQDCDNLEDTFRISESFNPDIILLDLALRDSTRTETLNAIQRLSEHALIVLTGDCDSATIAAAFKNGADDCLNKNCFQDRKAFIQTIRGGYDHFRRRRGMAGLEQNRVSNQITQAERDLINSLTPIPARVNTLEDEVYRGENSIKSTLAVVVSRVEEFSRESKTRTIFTFAVLVINMIFTIVGAIWHVDVKPLPTTLDH